MSIQARQTKHKRLCRYAVPSVNDVILPDAALNAGNVVRVLTEEVTAEELVRIADYETGALIGVVALTALRPI